MNKILNRFKEIKTDILKNAKMPDFKKASTTLASNKFFQNLLETQSIKSNFPIFKNNPEIIFLDSAATSQKSQLVIDSEKEFNENFYGTIGRGNCSQSNRATEIYEKSKEKIANFFGTTAKNIAITRGATESLNIIANGLRHYLKKGDVVLLSKFEHNSNLLPWMRLKKEIGIIIKYIEPDENGEISLENVEKAYDEKVKICGLVHASNITGQIISAKEIGEFLKAKGVLFFLDACQSAPHIKIDLKELKVDGMALSAHKMGGPSGIGLLYLSDEMTREIKPMIIGGGSACTVDIDGFELISGIDKFEAGTQSVSQVVGFAAACDFLSKIGFEKIEENEKNLLSYTFKELEKFEGIKILGSKSIKNHTGVISFVIDEIHPHDIGHILAEKGICLRVGLHCADVAHLFFGVGASVRISFWIYNDEKDVNNFIKGMEEVFKIFKK